MSSAARNKEQQRRDALDEAILAALAPPEQAAAIARRLGVSTAAATASLARLADRGAIVQVWGPAPAGPEEPTGTRYAIVPSGMTAREVIRLHDREA